MLSRNRQVTQEKWSAAVLIDRAMSNCLIISWFVPNSELKNNPMNIVFPPSGLCYFIPLKPSPRSWNFFERNPFSGSSSEWVIMPPTRKRFHRKVNVAKKASYNPAVEALWLKASNTNAPNESNAGCWKEQQTNKDISCLMQCLH